MVLVADYPPASSFGPRELRDHEFVWVLKGSARWTVDAPGGTQEVTLTPGMLALARQGTRDHYAWDPRRPSAHAFVHFSIDLDATQDSRRWPLVRSLADQPVLDGLCSYLLGLAADGSVAAQARSAQVLEWLFDLFVHGPLPSARESAGVSERLRPAVELVRSSWEERGMCLLGVEELASAAGISPAHFSRVFGREIGCPPARALEHVRLTRAAVTLQRSNLTIAEVARLTGFSNPYHFSKRFSAVFGVAPGRFRRSTHALDPLGPLAAGGLLHLWQFLTDPDV
jgi:AraC-like DNA-binding protein